MKKNILPVFILLMLLNTSCQNNISQTNTTDKGKLNNSSGLTANSVVPLELDASPSKITKADDKSKKSIETYLKKNDVFSSIPYQQPDNYKTKFTGDGVPAFFTGDGNPLFFTGDGLPIFGVKAEKENDYIWTRTPVETLVDYLQINGTVERKWGITNYAVYSQLIDHKIKVSGAFNNEKNVKLVKQVAFGITKDKESYKLYSISPLSIRRIEPKSFSYQVRSISFVSNRNKIVVYGDGKLIPLPGISVSKHIGNNKFKVYVEVVFSQLERPKEFAVVLGVQGKQYQMTNLMGNIYTSDIELNEITGNTGMAVELIDRKSLEGNDDYQGNTWIIPVAK